MRFNRFSVEPMEGHLLLHFGLVGSQGFPYDVYSCSIDKQDLESNRDRMVKYLEKIGGAATGKQEKWTPPLELRKVEVIRFISMSSTGVSGEIGLLSFALTALMTPQTGSSAPKPVEPDALALLTCSIEMQKYVIAQLYLEQHA